MSESVETQLRGPECMVFAMCTVNNKQYPIRYDPSVAPRLATFGP
jgi:hypothetical protein